MSGAGLTLLERQRISAIAHADSLMWGPIGDHAISELLARARDLEIGAESRIVDLGCGPAELLRRVCQSTGASGLGIDASPFAIEEARRRIAESVRDERIELRNADVLEMEPDEAFDLAICIGPGWDAGGWTAFATWVARFLRPGGHVLVADGAWRTIPPAKTLELLGMTESDQLPSQEVEQAVRGASVEPLWVRRSTPAEWRAYGDAYRGALQRFGRTNREDPITPAVLERAGREWPVFELLHEVLDFVIVLGSRRTMAQ